MTLLALAGNIGGRATMGFTSAAFISRVSAAAPMPKPDCLKKCRRVAARSKSLDTRSGRYLIALLLSNGLVGIHENVGYHGQRFYIRSLTVAVLFSLIVIELEHIL